MVTWEGCGQPVCTVLTPSTFHSDLPSPCHYSTKSYAFFHQPYPSRRTFAQPFTPSSPPSPHLSPPHLTSHPLTSPLAPSLHSHPPRFTCRPTPPTPSSPLAICRCTTSRGEGGWSSSGYPLTFSTATKRTLRPSQP